MKTVKINFSGFWPGFPKENLFTKILGERYNVEISDHPDFLFCSPLGAPFEYMNYDCVRICFTGEPMSADFILFDYMLGFDFIEFGDRYMRYPVSIYSDVGIKKTRAPLTEEQAYEILKSKTVFCNFIYGHSSKESRREEILDALSKYKTVDCAGTFRNNQPNGESVRGSSKFDFVKKSKFTICGESISYPGFTTEKLFQSYDNYSVPIYSGDPLVERIYNPKAFIHCKKSDSINDIVDRVIEVDTNDKLWVEMITQPITNDSNFYETEYNKLKDFLYNIFDQEPQDAFRRLKNYKGNEYNLYAKEYNRMQNTIWYKIGKKLKSF